MPRILDASRHALFKLVYFGLPGSGRATNLKFLHDHLDVVNKGDLTPIQTGADQTLHFEFLIPEASLPGQLTARFQLYAVAGRAHYRATHELLLRNADGVVLVIDSDRRRLPENRSMIDELAHCLKSRSLPAPVFALQFNKRDLANAVPVEELRAALEIPAKLAHVEATSESGWGVFETINPVCQAVLSRLPAEAGQVPGAGQPRAHG